MNTPNKLTVLRMIMIPFFLVSLFWKTDNNINYIFALIIFSVACITDALDGYLARKNNLITNFGKLMDPLADKLLVSSALISFIELQIVSCIPIIIIISREFLVTSIRMIALESNKVISANIWGKVKTIIQMISIIAILILLFLGNSIANSGLIVSILIWLSAVVTLVSGLTYIWDNRKIILS